uniref:Myelin protein zero like 3 n=1 Tax=Malurus cyaneus samueli TaxID=2593467 RepID=A0A8C5TL63_9PASS
KCSFKKQIALLFRMPLLSPTIIAFPSLQIFYYQSVPHPTTAGKFKDRISWVGNVARGDASIAIESPALSDNGTFTCSVKNPPDVYHNIPQTVLVVTERGKAPCPSFGLICVTESKGWTLLKVDWLHRAGEEMVFFYYSNHGVPVGRFKNRVQWRGNISRSDGSIRLRDVRVNDSGTYECELRLLQNSSIFKSQTELRVSPAEARPWAPERGK